MAERSTSRREWRPRAVVVPAVLAMMTCALLGTVGWYGAAIAVAYNCGMSGQLCGARARFWLVANGVGIWILAGLAIGLALSSRRRKGLRWVAASTCWMIIPAAAGWFVLTGRLM